MGKLEYIDRKILASQAAANWKRNFGAKRVHDGLVALGPNPNPDDVDRVIGNPYYTATECMTCHRSGVPVVRCNMGALTSICFECASEIFMAFPQVAELLNKEK